MDLKKRISVCLLSLHVLFLSVSLAYSFTVNYQYDGLHRLKRAQSSDGTIVVYVYDNAGNRTSYTVTQSNVITVNPNPDAINAPWILTGPGGYSHMGVGDQTLIDMTVGSYEITWGAVSGWIKPSPDKETKTLSSGAPITFIGTYTRIPQIQVTPSILNFGYVPPGSYKDLILVVKNIGGGILTGTVSACPPFSILSGADYSLGAGESQQVIVRYTAPLEEGSQTCSFVFSGGGGITIQAKGTNKNIGLPWLQLLLGN